MDKLGVGIVGTGWVSDEYIRSFSMNPRTEVRAICSRSKEKASQKALQHHLSHCTAYDDYETMLKQKDIDIVAVLTPNFMHAEQTIMAAEAKKHIVIEKPIAIHWADMLKMQKAVHENKVQTIVGFVLRWNPLFTTAKELISRDIIGNPFYAEVDYLHRIDETYNCYDWSKKRETGGSILQVGGCHAVDGLRWFMQSDATEVVALSGRYRPDFEQDTTITFVTKFANGTMGKVCCSYDVICPYIYNLKLYGEKGTLINDRFWAKKALPGQHDWITLPVQTPDSGDVSHHPFPEEVNHFVSTILDGERCIVDLDDAIKTFEIIEAADRSAQQGGTPIKLPLKD
ncbi:MAG: Gfo/Idh/MocA family oxidoreductase [Sphaerochaetaceae bacterium]|jgi:predicted dehydrogenase|nr:Gfo/Idh/MocA family oxidoreductase [Sphaerochaetaceae bacterium]MDD4259705.1 Gfo/Idh/MocA family oxidoreductase [Sphaerochaetaceae bacterium]MDD4764084.1 Gfo/Idh/MocA family oxidoreductase [Sphaerochaetaceae bacterium]MDD4842189.1 Gfo/Idh/MocA family oxidoreductase [Sphaerochaetaceae bacterium]